MPENFRRMSWGYLDPQCEIYVTDDQGNLVCVEQQFHEWMVSIRTY